MYSSLNLQDPPEKHFGDVGILDKYHNIHIIFDSEPFYFHYTNFDSQLLIYISLLT